VFAIGLAAAVATAVLAAYVSMHPFIPEDAVLERDVQSVQWGPLALTFPIYSWIGDAKGFFAEAVVFVAILVFNRRAWLVALGAGASAVWYVALSHLILRPRPTTATVLQVTEHPGASSFPSGHTIFMTTLVVVIVVCLVYRFVRGWGRAAAWVAGAAVVGGNVIDRIYTGAHWPSDVLAGVLVATAWLSLWLSWGPISRRIEWTSRPPSSPSGTRPSRRSRA
jgi:membrane-associated phospholipid phosphatase